jgi:hypothetical protein
MKLYLRLRVLPNPVSRLKHFGIILKARLSINSLPIWVIVNSNHLMLGFEYANQTSIKLNFSEKGDTDLNYWNRSLRLSPTKFGLRMLIFPILRWVCSRILCRQVKPILYTPHLSKHLYSSTQLFLLRIISKFKLISYYDDGMALVSSSGVLWKDNLLPIPRHELIGWNYAFRGKSYPQPSLSIALAYSSLVKYFAVNPFSCQSNNSLPYNFCCPPKKNC